MLIYKISSLTAAAVSACPPGTYGAIGSSPTMPGGCFLCPLGRERREGRGPGRRGKIMIRGEGGIPMVETGG
jgi:hypothetical protein